MRLPVEATQLWYGALVVTLVITASCSGGSSCGFLSACGDITFPEEPSISNLKVTPLTAERPNTVVRYSAQVTVVDFQGDALNGTCEIALSVGTASTPITQVSQGTVTCPFTVTVYRTRFLGHS